MHKKREPTAIGSFGLPHPLFPNKQKAHAINVSVSHYSRKRVFQSGSLNESSNKANAFYPFGARLRSVLLFNVRE